MPLHDRHEVGCRQVHRQVGPLLAHHGQPRIVAAGGDHLGAEMLAELNGGHADAARGAMHQQDLARLQRRAMDQRMVGGGGTDAEGRALGVGPARRQAHQVAGRRHLHVLGEGAGPHAEDHAIARLPVLHLGADRRDRARAFHAGNERQLGLVLVVGRQHQHVGKVHRRGADLDQHVGRADLGDRHVLDLQDGRIAQAIADDRPHRRLIELEGVLVVELQRRVLVFLPEEAVADHQHLDLAAHEAAEGVLGRADDRLAAHVEARCSPAPSSRSWP